MHIVSRRNGRMRGNMRLDKAKSEKLAVVIQLVICVFLILRTLNKGATKGEHSKRRKGK